MAGVDSKSAARSVLGSLHFNVDVNDFFYLAESTCACNFADDTTFYVRDKVLYSLTNRL